MTWTIADNAVWRRTIRLREPAAEETVKTDGGENIAARFKREWVKIRETFLKVLADFPEARDALVKALIATTTFDPGLAPVM